MIKVVGGKYRSRVLLTPPEETTLPTKNRVREAIASALSFEIPNAKVLDLFAGSGALGIEALSRGAASCLFVDADKIAAGIVRKNLESLKESNGEVWQLDYKAALERAKGRKFDLVFLDPPYANKEAYGYSIKFLLKEDMLEEGFAIVVEFEGDVPLDLTPFREVRRYTYGKSNVMILRGKA